MSDKLVRIKNRVVDAIDYVLPSNTKKGELLIDNSGAMSDEYPALITTVIDGGRSYVISNIPDIISFGKISYLNDAFINGSAKSILKSNILVQYTGPRQTYDNGNGDIYNFVCVEIEGYSKAYFYSKPTKSVSNTKKYSDATWCPINGVSVGDSIPVVSMYSLTDANQTPTIWTSITKNKANVFEIVMYGRNIVDYDDSNTYDNFPIPNGTSVKVTLSHSIFKDYISNT